MSDWTWNFPLSLTGGWISPTPPSPRSCVIRRRHTLNDGVPLHARWIAAPNPPDKSSARSISAIVRRNMWPFGHADIRSGRNAALLRVQPYKPRPGLHLQPQAPRHCLAEAGGVVRLEQAGDRRRSYGRVVDDDARLR